MRENLRNKAEAAREWKSLRRHLGVELDVLTFDWLLVFEVAKDKPLLERGAAEKNGVVSSSGAARGTGL